MKALHGRNALRALPLSILVCVLAIASPGLNEARAQDASAPAQPKVVKKKKRTEKKPPARATKARGKTRKPVKPPVEAAPADEEIPVLGSGGPATDDPFATPEPATPVAAEPPTPMSPSVTHPVGDSLPVAS
ncbi:hypothetical protein ACLESO_54495, partial [Pyxidicoccus sp. 3LG]